ncbi:hypothetical protein B5C34_11285 [Pacificimonas flava]|uniref:Uncharacterized protein n=2 Tax=Pacificimonas TaxID=1960290 RepID=A0A219B6K6_9SPHN|nr:MULTISPECIES: hypothetical protein [Pacificimonas]MBZ6378750.1 hypothetical protein [Pacificimonas aurantium]OWV33985.1 hypothetical protein B5C34_11285 [Pacificimonas flava]
MAEDADLPARLARLEAALAKLESGVAEKLGDSHAAAGLRREHDELVQRHDRLVKETRAAAADLDVLLGKDQPGSKAAGSDLPAEAGAHEMGAR